MDLIKIQPDKERARSLIQLATLRHKKLKTFNKGEDCSLILEGYYEVIKELITAILFMDGCKTLSHEDLVEYMEANYKELSTSEINLIDQLRKLRNKIVYYGVFAQPSFLKRNEKEIESIISKLLDICKQKLK